MQSTTLTTTSGLGSNFTSTEYTPDPIDSSSMSSLVSENKLQRMKYNPNMGTSSSFLESDLQPTEEYLYIPENPLISPQQFYMTTYECDAGKLSRSEIEIDLNLIRRFRFDFCQILTQFK